MTMSVVSESQEGDIGDDWKYDLQAKIYSGALQGQDTIAVKKHNLSSGATQAPPGPPAAVVIPAGENGAEIKVDLKLMAAEVDLLKNDTGEKSMSFAMTCPAAGAEPVVDEREITAGVTEAPTGLGNAVLTLKIRLVLANA
jgi:hypothetical protein